MTQPDFSESVEREIAKALVLAHIHACREKEKVQDETLCFYPHDFGNTFKALGWDEGCCIEVEIKWTHRATFP